MDLQESQTAATVNQSEPIAPSPGSADPSESTPAIVSVDIVTNGKPNKKEKKTESNGQRVKTNRTAKSPKGKHKVIIISDSSESTSEDESDSSQSSGSSLEHDERVHISNRKRGVKRLQKLTESINDKKKLSLRRFKRDEAASESASESDSEPSDVSRTSSNRHERARHSKRSLDIDETLELLGKLRELGDAMQSRQPFPATPVPVMPRNLSGSASRGGPEHDEFMGLLNPIESPPNARFPPAPLEVNRLPPRRMPPPPSRGITVRPAVVDNVRNGIAGRGRVLRSPDMEAARMPVNDEARPRRKTSKPKRFDYKRVDQVWDNARHQFLLEDTLEATSETRYFGYCFHVRRTFDWEGKYKTTVVDIKNKVLRDCIQEIIGDIKGVSFVEDIPRIDPNILFLYLEDMRRYAKGLKKQIANPPGADRRARKKEAKLLEEKRRLLKAMIEYIDRDYEGIKNSLYPLLEHGLITFDLLWALWKPGTFAYGTTYGSAEHPRALKVEGAEKRHNLTKGPSYLVFASHLDYDGKNFGTSGFLNEIDEFQGTKKITSLACYPLEYHPNEESLRLELIERGKKFVALSGVHYKFHRGMAYFKKKKGVGKVNVNGRIMVDAALHRRVNANYPVASIQPRDDTSPPIVDGSTDSDDFEYDDDDDHDDDVDSKSGGAVGAPSAVVELEVRNVASITKTKTGLRLVQSLKEGGGGAAQADGFAPVDAQNGSDKESGGAQTDNSTTKPSKKTPNFTDEEYLIASSVVFGFSLSMKLWLEFPVSGIEDITWNEGAYDSLVLKAETKEVVKSLVESHKFHAAESIDDVIEGKGKGLVAVLHGPPGTGKTLTAEGISELLKCPLYMVSAGELGIDSRTLEARLQQILEICHAWGAILLLDEADVFLEARNLRDIQRNALVSVFLRLLEYFQGILFLTTNRVETFDDAFQSRIHIALRYDPLDLRARKTIFKMFVDKACAQQKSGEDRIVFTDEDYGNLSRYNLNGRQIKNTVIRAQALAVNKAEPLSMKHVRQILDVQVSFDQDLKGGSGYEDAMRSYY